MKLGIISDIHEDIVSLRKALDILNNKRCDEIICLGDIVGYSEPYYNFSDTRDASECVSVVKANCNIVIIGNHDLYAIQKLTEFNNGFKYPVDWFDLDFVKRKIFAGNRVWLYEDEESENSLTEGDKRYLMSLPEYVVKNYAGISFLFSHYLYPDISGSEARFRYKKKEMTEHLGFVNENECLIGICGHAHVDGFLSGTKNRYIWKDYGKHLHRKKLSWIIGPCIAGSTDRSNGFIIFDTDSFEVEVVKLGDC